MRLLVDTQVWIWMRSAPTVLSDSARRLLRDGENELLLSAATPWEMAIKVAVGKLRLPCSVEQWVSSRIAATRVTALPITAFHAIESASLPMHHRDPFDRVLVAQARLENVPLMTADLRLRAYDVHIVDAT